MKHDKQKDEDTMNEAYKQLDGSPAGDAVSKAAKGEAPQTQYEEVDEHNDEQIDRLQGNDKTQVQPQEIEDAYANLFESLAVIMRHKV